MKPIHNLDELTLTPHAAGGNKGQRSFGYVGRPESAVDYWDGE